MRKEYEGYLNRKHNIGDSKMGAWCLSTNTEHFRDNWSKQLWAIILCQPRDLTWGSCLVDMNLLGDENLKFLSKLSVKIDNVACQSTQLWFGNDLASALFWVVETRAFLSCQKGLDSYSSFVYSKPADISLLHLVNLRLVVLISSYITVKAKSLG